jgi:hypothetical protein
MISPSNQLVPLARHSSLPELKSFVALFRPKRIVPNQLIPSLLGLDYACMPAMFGPHLEPGGAELIREDIRTTGILKPDLWDSLVLEVKDVQAENVTGRGAKELVWLWEEFQPEDVLKKPDMEELKGDDSLLGRLLTYLPPELANQLRVNLPQIKARHARKIRDTATSVEAWGESSSQTFDGGSQDESWLAAHFLPEAASQPIHGLSSPASDEVNMSRAILVSEKTLVAESTVVVSAHDGKSDASAAKPPPILVLDDALPRSSPQFESSAPSVLKEVRERAPSASLSKKRHRDPEPSDAPSKCRKVSLVREGSSSTAALASLKSISQKRPKQSREPSTNTSPSPNVYVSPKLERRARYLGFKDEAEIQNLAAMREKLRVMTSKPVEKGNKPGPVPDKPDAGSSSSPLRRVRNGLRNAEDDPGRSLKQKAIQFIKDGRSTTRLRCIGSQSQGP